MRFKLKIFERSQKDFHNKLYEDLLNKINVDLLKIFWRFLEEKILIKNLHQIFSSKNLLKKISEDLPKNEISCGSPQKIFMRSHSSWDLKEDLGLGYMLPFKKLTFRVWLFKRTSLHNNFTIIFLPNYSY